MNDAFKKFDLTGKTAVVTGGATGIGYEMTKALAQSGARVMMAARRDDVLKSAASELNAELGVNNVCYHTVDLLSRDSVKSFSRHASSTLGGVDIFIGNAGLEALEKVDDINDESIDNQLRVNLSANIELTRDFLPHMRKKKWGRLIYSSSAASEKGGADDLISVYGAAKSGLNAFARFVSAEAGGYGITANSLILGIFMTPMLREHMSGLDEAGRKAMLANVTAMLSTRRVGDPKEVGGLIQLLASDAGSYITGASIAIDGGFTSTLRPASQMAE